MNEERTIVIEQSVYNQMIIMCNDYQRLMDKIMSGAVRRPDDYVDIDYRALADYLMAAIPEFRAYIEQKEVVPWRTFDKEEKKEEEA